MAVTQLARGGYSKSVGGQKRENQLALTRPTLRILSTTGKQPSPEELDAAADASRARSAASDICRVLF